MPFETAPYYISCQQAGIAHPDDKCQGLRPLVLKINNTVTSL